MTSYVLDTSALVARAADALLLSGKGEQVELIVPAAVVQAFEEEARADHPSGWVGVEELKRLVALRDEGRLALRLVSEGAARGPVGRAEADAAARRIAVEARATLVTASRVQYAFGRALGIEAVKVGGEAEERLLVEEYFDDETMSVHLREGVRPQAKKGRPGAVRLEEVRPEPLTRAQVMALIVDTVEKCRRSPAGFVEIEGTGATVLQYGPYRIGIAIRPFSDGAEMTVVRPIARLALGDYALPPELVERLQGRAEGILVAGPPGAGKSTFARALAETYAAQGKVVKTMESPRDLQVGPEVSQYGPLDGSFERTADVLLLLRPDHTIFDELRRTDDFRIYADLRMAGVGMVGVTHASSAIDAVQRFIGRLELGMLPQVLDTVVFIRDGEVDEVLDVGMCVKVPFGMTESDLARPVIVVSDHLTGEPRFEIYTFGDETVVMPVRPRKVPGAARLRERIAREVGRLVGSPSAVRVEVLSEGRATVYVPSEEAARVVGPGGRTVASLERAVGVHLDVRSLEGQGRPSGGEPLRFRLRRAGRSWVFDLGAGLASSPVELVVAGDSALSAITDGRGRLRVGGNSPAARRLSQAAERGETVEVRRA